MADTVRKTIVLLIITAALTGCQARMTCPRAIFLDGAGWFSGDGPVRSGLHRAGYPGAVERFEWTSLLGPISDYLLATPSHPKVAALASRITKLRLANPDGQIILMGLSAGTSIVVYALERLPGDIQVDYVVLLSPAISSRHDLTGALKHVKHTLYATCTPHDMILTGISTADQRNDKPAGLVGLKLPKRMNAVKRKLYSKVVNIPWRPGYVAYGWGGGHVSVTSSNFIRVVIAPRIMDDRPYPLDIPLVEKNKK